MRNQFFKGTEKNPNPQPRLTRREKIVQARSGGFLKIIIKVAKFLFAFLLLLKPLIKLLHFPQIRPDRRIVTSLQKQLFTTVAFIFLLLLYFTETIAVHICSFKLFPKFLKERFCPFFTKLDSRCRHLLDPQVNGAISKIALIDLSIRNMLAKRNRTNITIGGMAIGIAAIVFLVSIGYGLQELVISRVTSLAELKQADVATQTGSKITIDDKSLNAFKQIPHVDKVLPIISVVGTVNYRNSVSSMAVYGVTTDYLKESDIKLNKGEFFKSDKLAIALLPIEKQDTAVLGASTRVGSFGDVLQEITYSLPPADWIRVRENPATNSPVVGYTRRREGEQTGEEVLGGVYSSDNSFGKGGQDINGKPLGKWIKSDVLLWEQKPCSVKTQGDCEDGLHMVMRDSANQQVKKTGYFAILNINIAVSDSGGQVLGAETSVLGSSSSASLGKDPSTGMALVEIASLSAPLKPPISKTVSLGSIAKKKAVVNTAMLSILGINENEAVGKTFQVAFTATGNLLADSSSNVQSLPATYTIVGVIPGDKTPLFYVPFVDLRSMGLTNFSQAKVVVDQKDNLEKVRRQIESKGFITHSVADTVAQINGVFATAQTVLALLGFVALAVASLGMFNTLTISLLERTREVGLMKAMGMRSEEVKELFLTESMIMSFFGGVFGLLLGIIAGQILSVALSSYAIFKGVGFIDVSYVPLPFILIILGLSLIVGLVTGIYPARRATKISALNALRYE